MLASRSRRPRPLAGLAGGLLALIAAAVPAAAADPEEEVRQVIRRFFELAERRDWDAVAGLFAGAFQLYTDGAERFDRSAYLEILKADDLLTERWELHDLEVEVSPDGLLAWSRYRGRFRTVSHGEASEVETAETLVLTRAAGDWKIVHAHASIQQASGAPAGPAAPRGSDPGGSSH